METYGEEKQSILNTAELWKQNIRDHSYITYALVGGGMQGGGQKTTIFISKNVLT